MPLVDKYALLAESYDALYAWRVEDIVFYLEEARLFPGPLLEAGCGTGRITLPMADLGLELHALDSSPAMLKILKRKLSSHPKLPVTVHLGEFQSFQLETTFTQIFVPFRGFLHLLDQKAQLEALHNFRGHLATDGRLILDVFAPSYRLLSQDGKAVSLIPDVQLEDGRLLRTCDHVTYDHLRQHIHLERHLVTIHPEGPQREQVESFTLRYIFRYEMDLLLAAAGFRLEEVYGGFDRRPYDYDSGEMIFIARPA